MNGCWHRLILNVALSVAVCVLGLSPALAAESRVGTAPQQTSSQPGGSQDAPSIMVAEKAHDFGEVMDGAVITHVFQVKNMGKAPLQITQVRPG